MHQWLPYIFSRSGSIQSTQLQEKVVKNLQFSQEKEKLQYKMKHYENEH